MLKQTQGHNGSAVGLLQWRLECVCECKVMNQFRRELEYSRLVYAVMTYNLMVYEPAPMLLTTMVEQPQRCCQDATETPIYLTLEYQLTLVE